MSDAPSSALDRLSRALSRVEKAVAAQGEARAKEANALARLDSRHDKLRTRIQETIVELDRLMASEAPRA